MSSENIFEQLASAILCQDQEIAAEEMRAAEAVGDFLLEMLSRSAALRSNSRRAVQYEILLAAALDLSVAGSDEDKQAVNRRATWEKFLDLLARGSYPISEGDHDGFRKAMVKALERGVELPGFSFVALAKEIQTQQVAAEIKRLRRKLGLRNTAARAVGKKRRGTTWKF